MNSVCPYDAYVICKNWKYYILTKQIRHTRRSMLFVFLKRMCRTCAIRTKLASVYGLWVSEQEWAKFHTYTSTWVWAVAAEIITSATNTMIASNESQMIPLLTEEEYWMHLRCRIWSSTIEFVDSVAWFALVFFSRLVCVSIHTHIHIRYTRAFKSDWRQPSQHC